MEYFLKHLDLKLQCFQMVLLIYYAFFSVLVGTFITYCIHLILFQIFYDFSLVVVWFRGHSKMTSPG